MKGPTAPGILWLLAPCFAGERGLFADTKTAKPTRWPHHLGPLQTWPRRSGSQSKREHMPRTAATDMGTLEVYEAFAHGWGPFGELEGSPLEGAPLNPMTLRANKPAQQA